MNSKKWIIFAGMERTTTPYHGSNVKVEKPEIQVLDNYNSSAYYEPSPYIARSYYAGGF